jgi:hypothetical protein
MGLREVEQEPFEDHLAEEAGHTREEDTLPRKGFNDALTSRVLYHAADYALSTSR